MMLVQRINSIKQATEITHTLSLPGKIPTCGYSISAKRCKVGSKLVKIEDSVCRGCYALKGWYDKRIVIKDAMEKRFQSLKNPLWVEAMAFHINHRKLAYFRWHDSGDLQGVWHLDLIAQVAQLCPDTIFWLPTREYEIVRKYWSLNGKVALNLLIPNLTIRLSAHMINQEPPTDLMAMIGVTGSGVVEESPDCPAPQKTYITNNGQHKEVHGYCGACRNCWNQKVLIVNYQKH